MVVHDDIISIRNGLQICQGHIDLLTRAADAVDDHDVRGLAPNEARKCLIHCMGNVVATDKAIIRVNRDMIKLYRRMSDHAGGKC